MAVKNIADTSVKKANDEKIVKKTGVYEYIDTDRPGIKKVVSKQGGYLAFLDYGRKHKLNKKTGKIKYVQDKTTKHCDTEEEAIRLYMEAAAIRKGVDVVESRPKKITMKDAIDDYKNSTYYKNLGIVYRIHVDNHFNHILDFFADYEPSKITVVDINNYYVFQKDNGYKGCKKGRTGISINTIHKHKMTLRKLWRFMVQDKKYGVKDVIVDYSVVPKEVVTIDNKEILMNKIPYDARPLSIDELNYTLNDIIQNEFDRSLLVLVGLAAIGGLRTGEIIGLKVGKVYREDLMGVSDDMFDFGNYDKEYYIKNDNLMMIDESVLRVDGVVINKLPKGNKIRCVAIPDCLKKIFEYAMEQRFEYLNMVNKNLDKDDQMYLPLINMLLDNKLQYYKLLKKWNNYQTRRNKRMIEAGLEPIERIPMHNLRHTHANLAKIEVPAWEISRNMGHSLPNIDKTTTNQVYWHDREPYRKNLIAFFDNNIKIEWDKALKSSIADKDNYLYVDKNGHIITNDLHEQKIRLIKRKRIKTEEDIKTLEELEYRRAVTGLVTN